MPITGRPAARAAGRSAELRSENLSKLIPLQQIRTRAASTPSSSARCRSSYWQFTTIRSTQRSVHRKCLQRSGVSFRWPRWLVNINTFVEKSLTIGMLKTLSGASNACTSSILWRRMYRAKLQAPFKALSFFNEVTQLGHGNAGMREAPLPACLPGRLRHGERNTHGQETGPSQPAGVRCRPGRGRAKAAESAGSSDSVLHSIWVHRTWSL